jgi:multicomponent Na+:H+ antiporter subunit D
MVIGFAMLKADALSGTAIYLVGHGTIKGALFLSAGILLHRCGSVDEYDLRGQVRNLKPLSIIMTLGALGLVGLPPFATFYGQCQLHEASSRLHLDWLEAVVIFAEALTAGAVLRFTGRIFLGWGIRREATSRGAPHIPMDHETAGQHGRTPLFMWVPAAALLVMAGGVAVAAPVRAAVTAAAVHFQKTQIIAAVTLQGAVDDPPKLASAPSANFRAENAITLAASLAVAALALFPGGLGDRVNWGAGRVLIAAMRPLRKLQSGHVGDYVAWFALGIAFYAGLLLILHRFM